MLKPNVLFYKYFYKNVKVSYIFKFGMRPITLLSIQSMRKHNVALQVQKREYGQYLNGYEKYL